MFLVTVGIGEETVVDIFALLLAILSICALAGAVTKTMLRQPKVWDEEDWIPLEIEEGDDETWKNKPHIWMD